MLPPPESLRSRVVRCARKGPTPFLASLSDRLREAVRIMRSEDPERHIRIVDVGAGSGDNMHFVRHLIAGHKSCKGYDLQPEDNFVDQLDLVYQPIPEEDSSVDVILCQYVLMFIPKYRLNDVLCQIDRMADKDAVMVLELFNSKRGLYKTRADIRRLRDHVSKFFLARGWVTDGPSRMEKMVLVKKGTNTGVTRRSLPDSGTLRGKEQGRSKT